MVPFVFLNPEKTRPIEMRVGLVLNIGSGHLTVVSVDIDKLLVTMRGVDGADHPYEPGPNAQSPNDQGMFWADPRNPLGS